MGCFGWMKELMIIYVEMRWDLMFRVVIKKVEKILFEGLCDCRERVIGKGRGVVMKIGREFKCVFYVEYRIKVLEILKWVIENFLVIVDWRFNEILYGLLLILGIEVCEMDCLVENDDGFDLV